MLQIVPCDLSSKVRTVYLEPVGELLLKSFLYDFNCFYAHSNPTDSSEL